VARLHLAVGSAPAATPIVAPQTIMMTSAADTKTLLGAKRNRLGDFGSKRGIRI